MPLSPTVNNFLLVLTSKLLDYDRRETKRELKRGWSNPNRMGLLLEAGQRAKDALSSIGDEASPEAIAQLRRALGRYFDPDFPPVKAVIKLIDSQPAELKYGSTATPKASRRRTSKELESDVVDFLSKGEGSL